MKPLSPALAVLAVLLFAAPAYPAHPLTVDDAGTLDPSAVELELSSAMMDSGSGGAVGVAARLGLSGSLDSGLGAVCFDTGDEGTGYELVFDLKFAPGRARGWRPRPFLRSDIAVLSISEELGASLAGLCGGLTWEVGQTVVSAEACWTEPLRTRIGEPSAWSAAAGIFLAVHRRATLAAEYRRAEWAGSSADVFRIGFLARAGRGSLSMGTELPVDGARFDTLVALLGWTAEFGL